MARKKQQINPVKLTAEQKRLLKEAEKTYKRSDKSTRYIMLWLVIVALIAGLVWNFAERKRSVLYADDRIAVSYIDVGQGDCEFICGDGKSMLIDCGESGAFEEVSEYLQKLGVKKIDYVVCTHPHSDHMGGMYKIIDSFDVGEAVIPKLADKDVPTSEYFERFLDACDKHKVKLSTEKVGRVIEIGDARAEIIAPLGTGYSNLNNYSIGIMLRHGRNSFLFTGDAEEKAEKEMAESGRLSQVTVYKAGHHGSDTAIQSDFMDIISPEYAVISCGKGNSYGHPHQKTLNKLKKYKTKVYRTDKNGTVVFESDGKELTVSTERK